MLPLPLTMTMMAGGGHNMTDITITNFPNVRGMGGNEERSPTWQHNDNNHEEEEVIRLHRSMGEEGGRQ